MNYRLATADDVPALAAMRWAFRIEGGEAPIEDEGAFRARYEAFVRSGLASGSWVYWVAEGDDGLVSHMAVCIVAGVPRPSRASDQWGYLTDCYTRPQHREMGIGSALMERVRAWAVARDLELLLAWSSDGAASFYARAGFAGAEGVVVLPLRGFDDAPGGA